MNAVSIVTRLNKSFDDLESCINTMKEMIAGSDYKGCMTIIDALRRVERYGKILEQQRLLVADLQGYIEESDWEEVERIVSLIHELSKSIREDALELLQYFGVGFKPSNTLH